MFVQTGRYSPPVHARVLRLSSNVMRTVENLGNARRSEEERPNTHSSRMNLSLKVNEIGKVKSEN
jgi:hypothetical protein